jgi:uncharacterized membrane protein
MERQYGFFHSGLALLVFVIGFILLFFGIEALAVYLPENRWLHYFFIPFGSGLIVWGAFRVDQLPSGRNKLRKRN